MKRKLSKNARKIIAPVLMGLVCSSAFAVGDPPGTQNPFNPVNPVNPGVMYPVLFGQQQQQMPIAQNPALQMAPQNLAQQMQFAGGYQQNHQQAQVGGNAGQNQMAQGQFNAPVGQAQMGYGVGQYGQVGAQQGQAPHYPVNVQAAPAAFNPFEVQGQQQQQQQYQPQMQAQQAPLPYVGLQPPAQMQQQLFNPPFQQQQGLMPPVQVQPPMPTLIVQHQQQQTAQQVQLPPPAVQQAQQGFIGNLKTALGLGGQQQSPLVQRPLNPSITQVGSKYDGDDVDDLDYTEDQSQGQQQTLAPAHHAAQGVQEVKSGRYRYLIVSPDDGSAFYADAKIAAQEVIFRKNKNLPFGDWAQSSLETFQRVADGSTDEFGPYLQALVAESLAVKRLQNLITDSNQLRVDIQNSIKARKHPWLYAVEKFVKSKMSERNFDADILSHALFVAPKGERLEKLRSLYAHIPPLSHPEYFRLIWAFDLDQQWDAHLILSEGAQKKDHPGIVFTRLKDFNMDLLTEWAPRISLEVLGDLIRKEHYSSHSLSSKQAVKLVDLVFHAKGVKSKSEKAYLGLRDQMRAFTENQAWVARDLHNLGITPKMNLAALLLNMTRHIEARDLAHVEKQIRHIMDQELDSVNQIAVKWGDKQQKACEAQIKRKGRTCDRGSIGGAGAVKELVENHLERIRKECGAIPLIDLDE